MSAPSQPSPKGFSDIRVLSFIIALCLVCAILLAVTTYSLQGPQQAAKEFDQAKQMLIAAKILNHEGAFILIEDDAIYPALLDPEKKILIRVSEPVTAGDSAIREISALRIRPLLTTSSGEVFTLKEKGVSLPDYLSTNKKSGYAKLPYKLVYAILPNEEKAAEINDADVAKNPARASAFVIPVSGFGLWAPIYGFIAVEKNGDTVLGTTWYEHAETPGLGANIAEAWWQKQFFGKVIFQMNSEGQTDFAKAPMGIIVVKGKVKDVYGEAPKGRSAVDGMSGATLTGDGVTAAYRDSLTPYRDFLYKIHRENKG